MTAHPAVPVLAAHEVARWSRNGTLAHCTCGTTIDCTAASDEYAAHLTDMLQQAGLLADATPPETPTTRVLDARADQEDDVSTETTTMTPERFGGKDYDDIKVQPIGDDGETFVAWGHVDPDSMARATRACYEDVFGSLTELDEPIAADIVQRAWAVELPPAGLPEWTISWGGVTAETPGAFPVTFVHLNY